MPLCCLRSLAWLSGQVGPPAISQCWLRLETICFMGGITIELFCWVGLKSMLCDWAGPLAGLLVYPQLQAVLSNWTGPLTRFCYWVELLAGLYSWAVL